MTYLLQREIQYFPKVKRNELLVLTDFFYIFYLIVISSVRRLQKKELFSSSLGETRTEYVKEMGSKMKMGVQKIDRPREHVHINRTC